MKILLSSRGEERGEEAFSRGIVNNQEQKAPKIPLPPPTFNCYGLTNRAPPLLLQQKYAMSAANDYVEVDELGE